MRKYDFGGNVLWTRQFGTVAGDAVEGIVAGSTGVYVVGYTIGGGISGDSTDAFVRRYDASGNMLWMRRFGTPRNDFAEAITADTTGVYVAGSTSGDLDSRSSSLKSGPLFPVDRTRR